MTDDSGLRRALAAMRPDVERSITRDRVRDYVTAISNTPAPSTAAAALRLPVLRRLLEQDGAFAGDGLHLYADLAGTGSPVIVTGTQQPAKPLWYFAHLDTISYLIQPPDGAGYPLVPFCADLIGEGVRAALAYRFDLDRQAYVVVAEGDLAKQAGVPVFRPARADGPLCPGDRIVPVATYREDAATGRFSGHVDNAGGVAALLLAAPVLARAGIEAMLAFPDEEEGPVAAGNQTIGRGGSRIVGLLPAPELAIIADVQQAGGDPDADARGGVENATRLGAGAVLAEFSSLARGAVTPPHLYVAARHAARLLGELGVAVQESNNAYSSRSDDVGVMLKTPNILLLGFPGFNRHFDHGEPRAHLDDIVNLAKALVYMAAVRPWLTELRRKLLGRVA